MSQVPALEQKARNTGTNVLVLDADNFKNIMVFAEMMASGASTVPKHLQKNKADCAAVIMQSMQWRMNPFAVAQKTHVVQGTLGYEAQLVNAVLNSMAPINDRLNFEWYGPWEKIVGKFKEVVSKTKKDDEGNFKKYIVPDWNINDEEGLGVKVWATITGETKPRELYLLLKQVRTRNSTLWAEDPKQQIAYLATKKWARLYCPDVILGVYTPDELDEIQPEKDITGASQVISNAAAPEPEKPAINVEEVLDAIRLHISTDALKEDWKKWAAQCEAENNLEAFKTIKAAMLARGQEITNSAAQQQEQAAQ